MQDDLFKPDYSLSLAEFRDKTMACLKKYCRQQFFTVEQCLTSMLVAESDLH